MKKHSKVLASALTVMLVASAMIGCAKKEEPAKTPDAGTPTKNEEPANKLPSGKSVLVWTHLDSDFPELKKQAEAWAASTGNKVTVVKDNNDMDKLIVAAKSPTSPDIMWGLPHDHLGQFAAANILEEISTDVIKVDEYQSETLVNTGKYNGKQYALPIFAETYAVFYNKDKVPTFPATWEEMIKAGKVQWDITNFYFTFGILATEGAYVFKNVDGTFDPTDIGLGKVEGYKKLEELIKTGHVDKNTTGDVPKNNFKTGKAEFYISGPWDVKDMVDAKMNFDVAPIPTIDGNPGKSFMGVQLGYIIKKNRDAEQKAVVEDLVRYLSTPESLAAVGKVGSRLPVKKGIEVEGVSHGFAEQIAKAEPMPNIPQMQGVWDPAKAGLTLLLQGTKDAQGAADYVQAEVTKKVQTIK